MIYFSLCSDCDLVTGIDANPDCKHNATEFSYLLAGTLVEFTCRMRFASHYTPVMDWMDEFTRIIPSESVINEEERYIESSIVMEARDPSLRPITCATHFVPPSRAPPRYSNPAMNDANYMNYWTTTAIPVRYG